MGWLLVGLIGQVGQVGGSLHGGQNRRAIAEAPQPRSPMLSEFQARMSYFRGFQARIPYEVVEFGRTSGGASLVS